MSLQMRIRHETLYLSLSRCEGKEQQYSQAKKIQNWLIASKKKKSKKHSVKKDTFLSFVSLASSQERTLQFQNRKKVVLKRKRN